MLDGKLKSGVDLRLAATARTLVESGISANTITLVACGLGLLAMLCLWAGLFWTALWLIALSRLLDGLDGAVARLTKPTDFGGFLDIVLDFVFYGAIPLGFVLNNPDANGLAGAFLLFSFYVNGSSFLAYAVMAEKHQLATESHGTKSIYFTTGLAEAAETYAVFALACLFPAWFPALAWIFGSICLYTALSRIMLARTQFIEKRPTV